MILFEETIEAFETQCQLGAGNHDLVHAASRFASIEVCDDFLDSRIYDCVCEVELVLFRIVV